MAWLIVIKVDYNNVYKYKALRFYIRSLAFNLYNKTNYYYWLYYNN